MNIQGSDQEVLEREKYRLAKAQEIGSIGTWELDLIKNTLSWTKENHNIFGIPDKADMTYETFLECVHPDDREYVNTEWIAGIDGKPYDIEHRIIVNSKVKWVREKAELIFDNHGKVLRAIGVTQDITERKQTEEKLRESENRFRGAFETAAHGMALVSPEGRWLKINQSLCEIVGYTEEELLATDFQTITYVDDLDTDLKFVDQLLAGEISSYNMEKRYFHKDGHIVWVLLSVSLVKDANCNPIHFVSQVIDISERKKTEKQLQESIGKVETANIAKSQFLANMSHEIRTPMNSIIGFTDILLDEELSDDHRDYIKIVNSSGKYLLQIINDILDFSKIEAGKLDIEFIEFKLDNKLKEIQMSFNKKAKEKGIEFKVNTSDDVPSVICSDPSRILQCLINLISNALKFTEDGHVHVNVSVENHDSEPFVRFDVEDTGIGIPKEKNATIFESFSQADSTTTRQFGGTGLGLSITKQLAELLGGELTVTSQEGNGSVFTLTIPVNTENSKNSLPESNTHIEQTEYSTMS